MIPTLLQLTELEPLPDRQRLVAIAVAVIILVTVLELVRRRKLREEYSILWIGTAGILLILALFRGLILEFAAMIGAATTPSALFFGALLFLLLLALQFSIRLSRLTDRNRFLAQRMALLEEELKQVKRERGRRHEEQVRRPGEEAG